MAVAFPDGQLRIAAILSSIMRSYLLWSVISKYKCALRALKYVVRLLSQALRLLIVGYFQRCLFALYRTCELHKIWNCSDVAKQRNWVFQMQAELAICLMFLSFCLGSEDQPLKTQFSNPKFETDIFRHETRE